jgi:hypothetical protein
MYARVCVCLYVCAYVHICVHICVRMLMCIRVCVCVCVYVCMCKICKCVYPFVATDVSKVPAVNGCCVRLTHFSVTLSMSNQCVMLSQCCVMLYRRLTLQLVTQRGDEVDGVALGTDDQLRGERSRCECCKCYKYADSSGGICMYGIRTLVNTGVGNAIDMSRTWLGLSW